jgi:hypothetical protein
VRSTTSFTPTTTLSLLLSAPQPDDWLNGFLIGREDIYFVLILQMILTTPSTSPSSYSPQFFNSQFRIRHLPIQTVSFNIQANQTNQPKTSPSKMSPPTNPKPSPPSSSSTLKSTPKPPQTRTLKSLNPTIYKATKRRCSKHSRSHLPLYNSVLLSNAVSPSPPTSLPYLKSLSLPICLSTILLLRYSNGYVVNRLNEVIHHRPSMTANPCVRSFIIVRLWGF